MTRLFSSLRKDLTYVEGNLKKCESGVEWLNLNLVNPMSQTLPPFNPTFFKQKPVNFGPYNI